MRVYHGVGLARYAGGDSPPPAPKATACNNIETETAHGRCKQHHKKRKHRARSVSMGVLPEGDPDASIQAVDFVQSSYLAAAHKVGRFLLFKRQRMRCRDPPFLTF